MKRSLIRLLCLLLPWLAACSGPSAGEDPGPERVIVAYVTSWTETMPDPSLMTHINYAFGHVTAVERVLLKERHGMDIMDYLIMMSEGKKSPHSSCSWFKECVIQVKIWVCQDRTTTNDNLHEKAKNYALNFLASNTELSINKDDVAREVADVVEKTFQKKCFDQRPPAYVVAQKERKKIPEDPEKKFIKLRP